MLCSVASEQSAATLVLSLDLGEQSATTVSGACRGLSGEQRAANKHCEYNHHARYISTHTTSLQFIQVNYSPNPFANQRRPGPPSRNIVRDQGRLESRESRLRSSLSSWRKLCRRRKLEAKVTQRSFAVNQSWP